MTAQTELQTISTGHGLLEGPIWDPKRGLLVADAAVGGVWCFSAGHDPRAVIAHRRGIGGMALHADGGIVIGGRNIAHKQFADEAGDNDITTVLLDNDPANGRVGFNDLTTDASGRIYVGSLGFVPVHGEKEGKPGDLYVIDLDGTSRIVARDILLTNGLGFSPDGTKLYHSDSLRKVVNVYDVKPNGDLGPKKAFAHTWEGFPDGLAVDSKGNVWVAVAHESRVAAFSPDGKEIASVAVPVPMVTSVCFGGEKYTDLYIVSGSEGLPTDRGAGIYRVKATAPGMARPEARVALKQS